MPAFKSNESSFCFNSFLRVAGTANGRTPSTNFADTLPQKKLTPPFQV